MIAAETRLKAYLVEALDGDAQAYRRLVHGLDAALRRYYRNRLGGFASADAEDLVQDALLIVHARLETFDITQAFTPWVYAIARYKLIDYYRRARSRAIPLHDCDIAFDISDSIFARLDVESLLRGLSPDTRTLVRDMKIYGFSAEEAGACIGVSATAAKVRVHRALKAISISASVERLGVCA